MSKRTAGVLVALLAITWCWIDASADTEYALKIEDKALPEEIEAEIAEQIVPKSYQISDAEGLFFEFWFVPQLEGGEIAEKDGDTLEKLKVVSLLGAMVVHREERYDFRDDPIDSGVYVLRYSLQPQDGNHMGTSPHDSFAILIPYDRDIDVREYPDHEEMVDIASEDTVAEHPPILAIQPMEVDEGEFPRLDENEEDEWKFMCIKFSIKAGDQSTEIPVQIVFEGIGEL